MENEKYIEGDFGGGANDNVQPFEADDTLKSVQTLRALFVISEGEIESVEDVYLDKTNITNYPRVTKEVRLGLPGQDYITGFSKVESPHPSNLAVQLNQGIPITKTVSSVNTDAVRATLQFNGLYQRDDNNNTVGMTVEHRVQRKIANIGTWETVFISKKEGKSSGPYAFDIRIPRPAGSTGLIWEFRITRITPNDTSKQRSVATWTNTIEIQERQSTYPYSALLALTARNATRFGGNLPSVMARAKGIKVKVPAAAFYDHAAKTYTGVPWDGTFDPVTRWTSNPAWLLYSILINSRYGAGIPESEINKFSFFELAKYCDEKVNIVNELGTIIGQEPRYEMHNQFSRRENIRTFLDYFLTLCNAVFSQDVFGNLTVSFDAPQNTTKVESNSSVIDGMFEYSSSSLEERHTRVNVTYNNADDFGNTDTVVWPGENPAQWETDIVNRYGDQSIDIPLVGCMSKGQAIRKAKWVFYTACVTPKMISYRKFINGLGYKIGEVVEVIDDANQLIKQQGVITGFEEANTLQMFLFLDRETSTLTSGLTKIGYYAEVGYVLLNIASTVDKKILVNKGSYSLADIEPITNTLAVFHGTVEPTKWKVSSISYESESKVTTITATQYDEGKFSYVDSGVYVKPEEFIRYNSITVPPVTNISVEENYYKDNITTYASLFISWDWTNTTGPAYNPVYTIFYRKDNGNYVEIPNITSKFYELRDANPGVYDFIVYATDLFALKSAPASYSFQYKIGGLYSSSLLPPINLFVSGTSGTEFTGKNLSLSWEYNTGNDLTPDRLFDYVIEIWDSAGLTRKNQYTSSTPSFVYTIEANAADFGSPQRNFVVKVYSRDMQGQLSLPIGKSFLNPPPATASGSFVIGIDTAFVNITRTNETDVAGYVVHMSTTQGFTPTEANIVYVGESHRISIPVSENTYYVKFAAYDSFGRDSLNYSSEYSGTALGLIATWTFTGLIFKANDPTTNSVSWTSGIAVKDSSTSYNISAGNAAWTSGILYLYYAAGDTILRSTNSLPVAVASGSRILATYEGGTNLIIGNGDAFISGDKLLAGTVGANALVTNTAVITNTAQVANGIITNAKIGQEITSDNYVPGVQGWGIFKNGNAEFRGDVIVGQTLNADRIISGSLIRVSGSSLENTPLTYPGSSAFEDIAWFYLISNNIPVGAPVIIAVAFTIRVPINTTGVRMTVVEHQNVGNILDTKDIYNEPGVYLEQRLISGTLFFTITNPPSRYLEIKMSLRMPTGGVVNTRHFTGFIMRP